MSAPRAATTPAPPTPQPCDEPPNRPREPPQPPQQPPSPPSPSPPSPPPPSPPAKTTLTPPPHDAGSPSPHLPPCDPPPPANAPHPRRHPRFPTLLHRLLTRHYYASDDTLVHECSAALYRAQLRLPESEITPDLIRERLAGHAELAAAEGRRQALKARRYNTRYPGPLENGFVELGRWIRDGVMGLAACVQRRVRKKGPKMPPGVLRTTEEMRVHAKARGQKPPPLAKPRPRRSVRWAEPVASDIQEPPRSERSGTGLWMITKTTHLIPEPGVPGTRVHEVRELEEWEVPYAEVLGAFKIEEEHVREYTVELLPSARAEKGMDGAEAEKEEKEEKEISWMRSEVRTRLALGWGKEEMEEKEKADEGGEDGYDE